MVTLYLNKEEKLEIENNFLKEQNATMYTNKLQKERQELMDAFCARNSQNPGNIAKVDLQAGTVEFKEEEKKDKRPGK